jgi:subtilisin family serine protease
MLFVLTVHAQTGEPEFVPGQILIKFNTGIQTAQVQTTFQNASLQQITSFSAIGVYQCSITNQASVGDAVRACRADASVAYAEPNYIYRASVEPNDPRLSDLWGLKNSNDADIDADQAWDIQTGSRNVLIGVIDTGVDYNHEDLQANMWRNPGESGGGKENNGVDDDNNGFIDDVFGWDFAANDNDPMDDNGHGTHVSGTIGAVGNNGTGVVGVNWQVSIMALKFLSANGSGTTDDAVEAIIYAADHGAALTSNSWGGGGRSQALEDAIVYARSKNSLFVAAAGNESRNTDSAPNYPSNYEIDNIISVAASDNSDRLASFSNFGRQTVDLAAPGVNILSCRPGNRYQSLNGTSMATPHVSGVAGLILAQFPSLNYRQVLVRLLGGVDPESAFSNNTVTGGRLNAFNSLSTAPMIFVTPLNSTDDTNGPYTATAEAVDDGSIATMTLSYSINGGANQTVSMQNTSGDKFTGDIPGQPIGTSISYFVDAVDNNNNSKRSATLSFQIASGGGGCGRSFITAPPTATPTTRGLTFAFNLLLLLALLWCIGKQGISVKYRNAS